MHWKTPPPTILFTHNVEAQVWERHYKVTTNPLVKAACWLESRALAGAERRYVELADHVLAVSENDRAFFLQYVDASRISVIPTGVDTEYFQPSPEPEQPDTMVFTGTMDWMPNEDGVAYFADKIFPLIRHEIPDAAFWAVGRRPPRRIQALASGSVVVTGAVEDIRPYLGKAAVCVVPLRSGSGTRIKIFEAMAMGKAVVSTTHGRRRPSRAPWREHHPGRRPGRFRPAGRPTLARSATPSATRPGRAPACRRKLRVALGSRALRPNHARRSEQGNAGRGSSIDIARNIY